MATVAEEDRRDNAFYIKKTVADDTSRFAFEYSSDTVGKYLIFNVYYTSIGNACGISMFNKEGKSIAP